MLSKTTVHYFLMRATTDDIQYVSMMLADRANKNPTCANACRAIVNVLMSSPPSLEAIQARDEKSSEYRVLNAAVTLLMAHADMERSVYNVVQPLADAMRPRSLFIKGEGI